MNILSSESPDAESLYSHLVKQLKMPLWDNTDEDYKRYYSSLMVFIEGMKSAPDNFLFNKLAEIHSESHGEKNYISLKYFWDFLEKLASIYHDNNETFGWFVIILLEVIAEEPIFEYDLRRFVPWMKNENLLEYIFEAFCDVGRFPDNLIAAYNEYCNKYNDVFAFPLVHHSS